LIVASLITAIATKPEVLVLLLFLLVPGFVFIRAVDTLLPDRLMSTGKQIIDVGFWSVANLAIWFLPALILLRLGPGLPFGLYYLLLFVLIVMGIFGTPVLLAYILHRLELRGTLKNLGAKPSPTPSDWAFSGSPDDHYYVCFHRKEGKDVGGYFGENSFAASSANGQEIYVEEVWRLDEGGRCIERVEGTRGAIVHREDCDLIEFFETPIARGGRTLEEGETERSANETDPTRKPFGR
jgi:hypothetical protein